MGFYSIDHGSINSYTYSPSFWCVLYTFPFSPFSSSSFLGHLIFLLLMMVFSVVLLISEFLKAAVVSLGTSYSDALVSVTYVDIFVSNSTPCNS